MDNNLSSRNLSLRYLIQPRFIPSTCTHHPTHRRVNRHGLVHAMDIVASQYTPLLTPTTTSTITTTNTTNINNTNATDSLLFGYIPAKQWKKWLKQYGCQVTPRLLYSNISPLRNGTTCHLPYLLHSVNNIPPLSFVLYFLFTPIF